MSRNFGGTGDGCSGGDTAEGSDGSDLTELEQLLKDIRHPDAKVFGGHYLDHIIDEIALEGLDGITLQALAVRLEQRPDFEMDGFEDVAATVWNQLKLSKSLQFFVLSNERPDLVKYGWDEYKDGRGNLYEPLHAPEDIYSYFPVEDKIVGIRGSCEAYQTRKDVSNIVRRVPYAQAIRLFGNRLVIVAVQSVREKALFGTNFKKQQALSIAQYCIVERIGRARHKGEITRGKISLQMLKVPPKVLFYMRKALLDANVVTKQSASIKFVNCRCPALITVFHLPRFYKRTESVASLNARTIFAQLNQSQTRSIPIGSIVSKYGKHTLRNLLHQFPELLETAWESVCSPTPTPQEEVQENKSETVKLKPKIKMLKLKLSNVNLQESAVENALKNGEGEDTDLVDTGEPEEEKVSCKTSNSFSGVQILRPCQEFTSITQSLILFRALVRSGLKGLTAKDMAFLRTTRLEARSATRYLMRFHIVKERMLKCFKQKSFAYTFSRFAAHRKEIALSLEQPYTEVLSTLSLMRKTEANLKRPAAIRTIASSSPSSHPGGSKIVELDITEANHGVIMDSTQEAGIAMNVQKPPNCEIIAESETPTTTKSIVPICEQPCSETFPTLSHNINMDELSKAFSVAEWNMELEMAETTRPTLVLVKAEPDEFEYPSLPAPVKNIDAFVDYSSISIGLKEEDITGSQITENVSLKEDQEDIVPDANEDLSPCLHESVGKQDEVLIKSEEVSRRGDQVDEEILRNMMRQRVLWNPKEDKLVLLAFIGSALFIPKYNYLKVFIYNALQIRNLLLQRNTDNGSAKTSLAIRRRLHFLMNQRPHYDIYVMMMGAALRDETLYINYVKDFLRPPQTKIYHLPPYFALNSVVEYLEKKFGSDEYSAPSTETPSNLNGIETLLFMRQLMRLEHFWKALIFLLFCPIESNLKSGRFRRFWRKVKENEHSSALNDKSIETTESDVAVLNRASEANVSSSSEEEDGVEHEDDIITVDLTVSTACEKNCAEEGMEYSSDSDDEDSEEIGKNLPFRLELDYCFTFMRFIIRHCEVLSHQFTRLNVGVGKFSLVAFDMNATSPNICYTARECNSDLEIRVWTARCIILDHIMAGDTSRKAEKSMLHILKALPMEKASKSLERAGVLVYNKAVRLLGASNMILRTLTKGLDADSFDDALYFVKYLEEAPSIDSSACINSGVLSCLAELTDHFRSTVRINESFFSLNNEWVPVYDDLVKDSDIANKSSKKRKKQSDLDEDENTRPKKRCKLSTDEQEKIEDIMECIEDMERELSFPKQRNTDESSENGNQTCNSTNTLRLLRIRMNEAGLHMPGKIFRRLVQKDFFNINMPDLEFTLRKTRGLNHRVAGKSHPFSKNFMNDLRSHLIELAYHCVDANLEKTMGHVLESIGKYRILFELIDIAGSQGLSAIFLLTKFTKASLVKGLHYLLDAKVIFSMGVKHRRFVTFKNAKDWLIAIRSQNAEEVVGHAVMRPWLTPHGAISWVTVNRLIIALLGQLYKPSTELDAVCQSLQPILSPLETLILIEVLVKIKFLIVYKLKDPKPELLSQHPLHNAEKEYHVETLVDTDDVFVAVSPYTTFLHAQLQEAILRECSVKAKQDNEKMPRS